MGEDVKLKLVADNSDYIKKVKQAQDANQKLYDTSVKGAKNEINILTALENSLKNIQARRAGAFDEKDIDKWDKKLIQAKKDLEEYNKTNKKTEEQAKKTGEETAKSTDKAEKSSGNLLSSLKRLALGYFSVTTALRIFNAVVESTEATANRFHIIVSGWKGAFDAIATSIATLDFKNFGQKIRDAIAEGERYAGEKIEIDDKMRALEIKRTEKFNELLTKRNELNTAKDKDARIKAGNEVVKIEKDLEKILIDIKQQAYQNESKNLQQKTKLTEKELLGYIKNEDAIRANIEAGKEYNQMITDRDKLQVKSLQGITLTEEESKKYKFLNESIKNTTEETKRFAFAQANMKGSEKLDLLAQAYKDTQLAAGEALSNTIRIQSRIASEQEQTDREGLQKGKEVSDKKLKIQEDYKQAVLKLQADYDKSNIESLTGVDKLKAIRDFGLKQVKEARTQLSKLGTITAEQDVIFTQLGVNVWKAYMEGLKTAAKETPEQKTAISKALLEGLPTVQDLQHAQDLQKGPGLHPPQEKEFSFWKLIGVDPESEEGKKVIEMAQQTADQVKTILDDMYAKRVEDTQRRRELLDTQVSEAQSALESEIELYKSGYASNVTLKKKEVEDLKKQRAIALVNEEKALKQQRIMDSLAQTSAIATSAANIIKGFSKMPIIGQILSIAAIALMIGTFIAAKTKAAEVTKGYYKGGWTGEGSGRDSTGERVAGVVHEKEFVVKRGPAHRFRDVLEAINKDDKRMIFNSFNKLKPEIYKGTTVNNVVIENDGSNKRLDKVNNELEKLNKKGKDDSIQELSNKTIYRKGNTTRIVRR